MGHEGIRSRVERYYSDKLIAHGPTAAGVDWNSAESQRLRFSLLVSVIDREKPFTVNDYGCGYGALVDYLEENKLSFHYRGLDISDKMVSVARQLHPASDRTEFVNHEDELCLADYTLASGVFNVKLQTPEAAWERYVLETLDTMNRLSLKGVAFNILTKYSDPEFKRADLYYADPLFVFDYCKRNFSRFVSLLHDYPLYEFTILVRKP